MKYKVGDKVRFVKDCALSDGNVIPYKTVWVVREIEGDCYLIERVDKHLVVILEHGLADDSCEKINEAPSITKRINDKHNILNGLLNSDGSVDGEKLMEKLASDSEEPEKAINLLREMKHNCKHANKYDDPKRHDKAKALGFAIELIEHGCSAEEPNYKPEKPEEAVKLYTWQDLCDYEILLHEKWRIANEQRMEQGQELSVMHTLRQEYMEAIKMTIDKLGRDVPVSKAKELGVEV